MSIALLCSGQGRQSRDMMAGLADVPEARATLGAASTLLGQNIETFLATAPEAALQSNRTGQILCVARSLATAVALFPEGAPPATLVAGYSVGEMAAWSVAGVWPAADTLALVDQRAAAMDMAGGDDDGLGHVRGLPRDTVERLAEHFGCAIAIVNPDRLFVVGGARQAVIALCAAALSQGAARASPLPVHVASHTPKLADVVAPFAAALAGVPAHRPNLRLMSTTDQRLVVDPALARNGLAAQVATTIDWAALLQALAERRVRRVLELGPGTALAEMARGTLRDAETRATDEFRSLRSARDWLLG